MLPTLPWRQVARMIVIPTILAVLVVLPWTIRNYAEYDSFVPVRTGSSMTLYLGLGEIPGNPLGIEVRDGAAVELVERIDPTVVPLTPEFDDIVSGEAFETIRQEPDYFAQLLADRVSRATILNRSFEWPSSRLFGAGVSDPDRNVPWLISRYLEPAIFVFALLIVALTSALWRRYLILRRSRWRSPPPTSF